MTESDRLVGKVLAGTYQVVRMISKGGMGAVYEASHARLHGKRYAIKVVRPQLADDAEALARFRREAEIASQLGHDHIVAVHDFNFDDGMPYMVMDLLDGEDLAARLRARGQLPLDQIVHIVDQIASALDVAHRAHIVHRDLKPQNVFLCRRGGRDDHVVVLDFGVSKVLDSASVMTMDNALIGTPFYMSPEQAHGRIAEIDQRTDVFAFGAMIWEMLTGTMAFGGPTFASVLHRVCNVEPPDVQTLRPNVPPAVSTVLRRALAKEREQRTPSIVAVATEFAAALQMPVGSHPGPRSSVPIMHTGFGVPAGPGATVASVRMPASAPAGHVMTVASGMAPPPVPTGSLGTAPSMPSMPSMASMPSMPSMMTPPPVPWSAAAPAMASGTGLAKRRRSRVPFVLLGIAAAAVGVALGMAALRIDSGSPPVATVVAPPPPVAAQEPETRMPAPSPEPAPAPPVVEPTVEEVVLQFSVQPASATAEITLGNQTIRERMIRVAKSHTPQTITAEASGFQSFQGEVVPDHDQQVVIALKRKPSVRPARTAQPPPIKNAPETARPVVVAPPPVVTPPPVITPSPSPSPSAASTAPPPAPPPKKKKKTGTIFD